MTASPTPATQQNNQLTATPSKKGKPTARTRKRLADAPPLPFVITNLAHDGRGVAVYGTDDSHISEKKWQKSVCKFCLAK